MSLFSIWTRLLTVRINRGQYSQSSKGIGFKYVANLPVETENPAAPETIRLQIETPCYQRNVEETKLATISEQMRLLYVAMTRAELKLYLVGKGREDKLA